jgi:hypothetical protein
MATAFHVNGIAEIKVGTGTSGALETLGHTINGVYIDPQLLEEPIYTDAGGGPGGVPATHVTQGEIHIVTAELIVYDVAVLAKIRKGMEKTVNSVTEGTMQKAGQILDSTAVGGSGVGGWFRLLILSPDDSEPRNYLTARLTRKPRRMSTRNTIYELQFKCVPLYVTANSLASVVLFNTTTS